ncbi:MAG: hypothetical protein ABI397_00065 [Candidatus Saccharimonas sp.]
MKRLQFVKTWQLVILLILMSFVSATFLRLNNTDMVIRRNAIMSADKTGNQDDITARIYDLQRYATAHMNADPGVFYLQDTYNRDVKQLMGSIDNSGETGANSPQARADAICNPRLHVHGYSKEYQDCIISELSKQGQIVDPSTIHLPSPSLYRYAFASPTWSPDFAGWSLAITAFILIIILARLVSLLVLRLLLKRYFRNA